MKSLPISCVHALTALPGDAPVRLYSYQGRIAWDRAVERGYWTGSDHVHEEDHGWGPAYEWMRRQMAERVPEFSGDLPMWAWAKRPSTKPRPSRYRGTTGEVRLTVVVPRSRIVFSDYDAWHCVLNRSLLCATEAEWERHAVDFPDHWSMRDEAYEAAYIASIQPSWTGCLEFESTNDPQLMAWSGSTKSFRVQACVDRFHWEEIVGVRWFGEQRQAA